MDRSLIRSKNGRDFAGAGAIVAVVLVVAASVYFDRTYADTPSALLPWYAANAWVNLVIGVLAGAIIGWSVLARHERLANGN